MHLPVLAENWFCYFKRRIKAIIIVLLLLLLGLLRYLFRQGNLFINKTGEYLGLKLIVPTDIF